MMAAWRIAVMNLRLAMRTRAALFFTFIFPLIFLFAYGGIFAHGVPAIVAYLFGPVVVFQIIGSTLFGLGMQSVMLRERGSLRRYRLAPIGAGAMIFASLIANYLLLLPTVALLFVCAVLVFHMPATVNLWQLLLIVTVGDFGFAGFGLIIGSLADSMQEAQVYNNVIFFPLIFLSGATIPLPELPHWLQRVAAFIPATYLVSAFQGIMPRPTPLAGHVPELAGLVISGVCGVLLAAKLFRWEKEERIPTRRKLWAAALVVPFLLTGAWMNASSRAFSAWQRALQAVTSPSPAAPAAPPSAGPGSGRSFVIEHARIFDGATVLAADRVIVRDGRIAAVGRNLPAPHGAAIVDASGDTLLPGLIDAHVHVIRADLLNQALIFGVTTELDMFMDYHLMQRIERAQAAGQDLDMADLRSAGTLVTAPGGHGTEYGLKIPTLAGPQGAQAFVDARLAEGSNYIKIIDDDGHTYGVNIPTLSPATIAAVVRAAHARHQLAVAHIGSYQEAVDAIDAGVDGLMHLFVDRPPAPDFGRFAAAHHVFVVPTLTLLQSVSGIAGGAPIAADAALAPYLPAASLARLKQRFPRRPGRHTHYANAVQALQLLRAAGVPILAGTDAANPGTTHGASLHRELALLVAAGMTPMAALRAATLAPAQAFHLADRGRIAPGLRADLLLVRGDATRDIQATRAIAAVWKLGVPAPRAAWRETVAQEQRAKAAAPAGSDAGLISDFDEGAQVVAKFGAGWQVSTDALLGGKSTARIRVVAGGAQGSRGSLEVSGVIAAGSMYPWAGAIFYPGAQPFAPADLTAHHGLSFWAKGDGKTFAVMVFSQSLGNIPAVETFTAGPEWRQFVFPWSAFQGTDGHDIEAVIFSGVAMGAFQFQIDSVALN